jgi:hypothetical protein
LLVGNAKTRIPYLFFRLGDQESEMFIIEIGVSALVIALQEFEIGDQIIDLVGVQFELRHFRVYRPYILSERLFEIFDRVAVVQRAKRRRFRDRAITGRTDRMTSCAIRLGEDAAAFERRLLRLGRGRYQKRHPGGGQRYGYSHRRFP